MENKKENTISKISSSGFKILGVEHIGIALRKTSDIAKFLSILPGVEGSGEENIEDQGAMTDIYNTARGKIELLKATSDLSPIYKFLNKKGKGIHHIALEVDDIVTALKFLKENDIQLIDDKPRIGAEGFLIAFIHPYSTGGILFELCQKQTSN